MPDPAWGFIATELLGVVTVFLLLPGVTAAVLTGFGIVVGRQLGVLASDRATRLVAVACALVAPIPELFLIDFWPADAPFAWRVMTWVTLLPGALLGALVAARYARRFRPFADGDAGDGPRPVGSL